MKKRKTIETDTCVCTLQRKIVKIDKIMKFEVLSEKKIVNKNLQKY